MGSIFLLLTLLIITPKTNDVEYLYQVVCSECQECSSQERIAIAHVVLNRVRHDTWPNKVNKVITQRRQFASINLDRCQEAPPKRSDGLEWSPSYLRYRESLLNSIRQEVENVYYGRMPDPTNGALFFHTKELGDIWDFPEIKVPSNWRHRFFRI